MNLFCHFLQVHHCVSVFAFHLLQSCLFPSVARSGPLPIAQKVGKSESLKGYQHDTKRGLNTRRGLDGPPCNPRTYPAAFLLSLVACASQGGAHHVHGFQSEPKSELRSHCPTVLEVSLGASVHLSAIRFMISPRSSRSRVAAMPVVRRCARRSSDQHARGNNPTRWQRRRVCALAGKEDAATDSPCCKCTYDVLRTLVFSSVD